MATRAETSRAHAALGRRSRSLAAAERRKRYGQLRRGGFTIKEAMWDLRVSRRTADRYEAKYKKQRNRSARRPAHA